MSAGGVVRLAPLDERTWKPGDDRGPAYSPFNTRFADSLVDLEYEGCELRADDVVVELDVEATSISKDGTRLLPNRPGPRTGRVRVTLDRPNEPPMIFTMAGLYSNRQPGHALALRSIVATLKGLRDLDRWGVVQGRQYTGMLAIESGVAMGGSSDGTVRDRAWAVRELAEVTGLPETTKLADLFGAARYLAQTDEARERVDAARAVITGQEALDEREDFERWRREKVEQREIESGDDHG